MKMAKASEKDIEAAGNAMSVLSDISSGYYPARGEEDAPTFFDESDPEHLRRFFDLMNETLNIAPGWPGRVIGGMCFVILYDKNRIVDPDADVLELHPRFAAVEQQRTDLLAALKEAREVLQMANDTPNGPICDTIWMMHRPETMFDFMDAAIAKAEQGGVTC